MKPEDPIASNPTQALPGPEPESEPELKPEPEREDIAALAAFIRSNFVENLHVEDFVKETHLSKHHLIRLFEKQIGLSPYRYLHLCRVRRAEILLRDSEYQVAQIAYGVGYNSPTVLIRHFRAFFGTTPGEYRVKCRETE